MLQEALKLAPWSYRVVAIVGFGLLYLPAAIYVYNAWDDYNPKAFDLTGSIAIGRNAPRPSPEEEQRAREMSDTYASFRAWVYTLEQAACCVVPCVLILYIGLPLAAQRRCRRLGIRIPKRGGIVPMTDVQPTGTPRNNALLFKFVLPVVAGVVLIVVLVSQIDSGPSDKTAEPGNTVSSEQNSDATKPTSTSHVTDEIDTKKQELAAQASISRDRFLAEAQDALRLIEQARSAIDAWSSTPALLLNKDGQRIASDLDLVQRFDDFNKEAKPTSEKADQLAASIDTLSRPVNDEHVLPKSDYEPSNKLFASLSDLADSASELHARASKYEAIFQGIMRRAEQLEPADITLEAALARLHQRYADEAAEEIRRSREQGRKEADQALAEAERERQNALAEDTAAAKRAEADRIRAGAEAKQRQAQTDVLRARAEDATIQAKYAPFLTRSRQTVTFFKNETPQPVSVRRIEQLGAHIDYKAFARVGAGHDGKTGSRRGSHGRPTWPYPQTEADFDKYKPLFAEFWELAPIWVQTGVLNP